MIVSTLSFLKHIKHSTNCQSSYSNTILAPAASSLAFICSASSFFTPFLSTAGAPSTSSFASLRPRSVMALTSLITLILEAASNPSSLILKSVFSSAGAAASAAAGAPGMKGNRE